MDDDAAGVLLQRSKIVRSEFVTGIEEHWQKQALVKNIVTVYD